MKNTKKLSLLLSLPLLVLGLFFMSAVSFALSNQDLASGSYTFNNNQVVAATIGGKPYQFIDKDTGDSDYNFAPPQVSDFCKLPSSTQYPPGVKHSGITFLSNPYKGGSVATATIVVGIPSASGANCNKTEADNIPVTNAGPSSVATASLQWNKDNIETLDAKTVYQPYSSADSNRLYGINTTPGQCGGQSDSTDYTFIVLDSPGSNSGTEYALTTHAKNGDTDGNNAVQDFPALKGIVNTNGVSCYGVQDWNSGKTIQPIKVTVSGQNGMATNPVGTQSSATGTTDSSTPDACETGTAFDWIVCPALGVAQGFCDGLINLFESQLSFTVGDLGNVSGGNGKIEQAWSTMRVVASLALVIVMLIMVMSQATSWGAIDAYTVRKMLPRLVVAVILIQISWNLFAFGLTVVNDVSKGLADLMFYPFGGAQNMDLGSLLANANIGTGQLNSATWTAGVLAALLATGILGVAAAPAVLSAAVTAAFALLTGLVALMFRKILIIACLVFSPIALITWILPGTQKYWKMWWDNFSKALMMFPLVVVIVASGRIFAYVAGTQKTAPGLSVLLNFIIIMVGYFAPLFILPKTFKWGGSLMQSVGGSIQSTLKPLSENASKGAHGLGERFQGRIAKSYNPNPEAQNWGSRTMRRIGSGHIMPTKRSRNLAIQAGDKWSSEEDELADAMTKREGEKAQRDGYKTKIRDAEGNELSADRLVQDEDGNYLDKEDNVVYHKQVDENGKVFYTDVATGRTAMDAEGNLLDENEAIKYYKLGEEKGEDGEMHAVYAASTDVEIQPDGSVKISDPAKKVKEGAALSATFEKAMHQRATNEEKAAGHVQEKVLYGVAAMKQLWVDRTESKDKFVRKMAIRRLTATASWPELQGSFTQSGKKVMETQDWSTSITTSPEDYPRVLRSRVDAAPHIVDAAKAKAREKGLAEGSAEFDRYVQAERMNYAISKQMSNEDFQTQSDGFWEDAARLANQRYTEGPHKDQLTEEAVAIREGLKRRFEAIAAAGGTAPQQLLGHLVGGGVQKSVDKVLGAGVSVQDYLERGTAEVGRTDITEAWRSNIPGESDLTIKADTPENARQKIMDVKAAYKGQLLSDNARAANTLAEGLVNTDSDFLHAHPLEIPAQIQVLMELRAAAEAAKGTLPEMAERYNLIIRKAQLAGEARVQAAVRAAVQRGETPERIAEIQNEQRAVVSEMLARIPGYIEGVGIYGMKTPASSATEADETVHATAETEPEDLTEDGTESLHPGGA